MHVMGKVGVWLVVFATIASTILTAKLIQVRNSWTKVAGNLKTSYQELQTKIGEMTEQQARLEAELFRSQELFGKYLNNKQVQVRVADGFLQVAMGMRDGIAEKQVLYGFEIQPNGTTIYRGDFTVVTARDDQSALQPNWKVRPDDVQTWQPQANWRWRNVLPPGYQQNFDQQLLSISKSDQTLADRNAKLAVETSLDVQAKDQLKRREAELTGGDQLSKDPAVEIEYREGLVAAVEEAEESRNKVLLKIDELRRRLKTAQHNVEQIEQDNTELTRKLPQPETSLGSAQD